MLDLNVKNFRVLSEAKLSFGNGIYTISGDNRDERGAGTNDVGKSTLLHAVYWALTGELPIIVSSDSLIRYGQKEASVSLSTPRMNIRVSKSSANSFDAVLDKGSPSEYVCKSVRASDARSDFLLKIGLPQKKQDLILRIGSMVYLSAFSPNLLMLRSDTEKTEFVNSIIDVSKFEDGKKKAKLHRQALELEISTVSAEISNLKIFQANSTVDPLEENRLQSALSDVQQRLTGLIPKYDISKLEFEWSEDETKLSKAKSSKSALTSELQDMIDNLDKADKSLNEVRSNFDETKLRDELNSIKAEWGRHDLLVKSLEEQIKSPMVCPSCTAELYISRGKLHSIDLAAVTKLLGEERLLRAAEDAKFNECNNALNKILYEIRNLESNKVSLQASIQSHRNKIETFSTEIVRIERYMGELSDKILTFKTENEKSSDEFSPLKARETEIIGKLAVISEKKKSYDSILTSLVQKESKLKELVDLNIAAKFWEETGFPDIMESAYTKFFEPISEKINEHLRVFGVNQRVRIKSTAKKSFDVKVFDGFRESTPDEMLSQGKARRVQLATALALRDYFHGNYLNDVLMVDELDGFDAEGVEYLNEVLSGLDSTVLVVTNNKTFQDRIVSKGKITLVRENGIVYIGG